MEITMSRFADGTFHVGTKSENSKRRKQHIFLNDKKHTRCLCNRYSVAEIYTYNDFIPQTYTSNFMSIILTKEYICKQCKKMVNLS